VNAPYDLVMGDGGMLYVGDINNQAIRRIRVANGETMTVASNVDAGDPLDGNGSTTRLPAVRGMCYDSKRGLFFQDGGSLRLIERIVRNGAP
jgi:hypothetical protein